MPAPLNIVLLVTDGHGHHTGDHDWGTTEYLGLRSRLERLELGRRGFAKFNRMMSPAVSTIMSIESMLTGLHAAKTHKLHWREWPEWDRLDHPTLGALLEQKGYAVHGFSYLLNADNWIPGLRLYRPELYADFPSHKRDTHSHHAVLAAVKDYFTRGVEPGRPQCLMVHSIFLFDFWDELMELFAQHGLTDANTVFAFTSDHYFPKNFGRQWLLGERDGVGMYHHTDLTEYNTRVFLYLKYPGLQPREIDAVVSGCDLTPTLLELLGLRAAWPGPMDGVSLLPLLAGNGDSARFLRADNVYPYQIGEKQGRITALWRGRWKYVARPDPASSYVSYRMHEPCGRIPEHEEYYDVAADPEEQHNLVDSRDPAVRAGLEEARVELRRTTNEIIQCHADGLVQYAGRAGLAATLLPAGRSGRILCFQSCPPEVAVTLVHVLAGLLPGSQIDLLAKDTGGLTLPANCTVVNYPAGENFATGRVREVLGARLAQGYDCLLRVSNVPIGAYAAAYDEAAHPVADFPAAGGVMVELPGAVKLSLALDCSVAPLHAAARPGLAVLREKLLVAPGRWLLAKLKPRLRKLARSLESTGLRMPGHFSERIIRKADRD